MLKEKVLKYSVGLDCCAILQINLSVLHLLYFHYTLSPALRSRI
jgi:hypothetical protein